MFLRCGKAQQSSGLHLFRAAAYESKCRRVVIHVRDMSVDLLRLDHQQVANKSCMNESRVSFTHSVGWEICLIFLGLRIMERTTQSSLGHVFPRPEPKHVMYALAVRSQFSVPSPSDLPTPRPFFIKQLPSHLSFAHVRFA